MAYPHPAAYHRPPPIPQPDLSPYNGQRGSYVFSLDVVQQPERARMCGFGDKDRRPITPPPCVRLIIKDVTTGREVNPADINAQHFVLNVDLFRGDGAHAANLVKHSSNAPSVSISMAQTTSFPPPPDPPTALAWATGPNGHPIQVTVPYQPGLPPGYHPQQGYYGQPPAGGGGGPGAYRAGFEGHFTRNLIGSVAVSAAVLNDTSDQPGFWFVLQDLSVRQEGTFRLKLSFVDVSELGAQLAARSSHSSTDSSENGAQPNCDPNKLATTSSPVLATCYSEQFQVHSAKKFPGVKESTQLSKCFASQGVKIPIRKEGRTKDEEDED
ncbi:MAG: hypothetical protein Q9162_000683 [Coniocarpon cinnabarinum]